MPFAFTRESISVMISPTCATPKSCDVASKPARTFAASLILYCLRPDDEEEEPTLLLVVLLLVLPDPPQPPGGLSFSTSFATSWSFVPI
jgi:hypothetical protein